MHRRVREILVVGAAVLVVSVVVGGAVAQEAGPVMPKYPIRYVLMHKVDSADLTEYQGLMAKFVAANKQHENGGLYAAYRMMTGGPEEVFYYVYPAEKMSDFDSWLGPAPILRAVYGAEQANELLRGLGAITSGGTRWLSGFAPAMANLDPEKVDAIPKYAYFMHITVKAGHANEYMAAVRKLAVANQNHPKGMHWSAGYRSIGGSEAGPEYGIVIGFDRWAELDDWPEMPEVLAAEYGEEEAMQILQTFSNLAHGEAHFMELVPEFSNLPEPE